MIIVRCRECNTEIKSGAQTHSCGCPNMLTVTEDTFSAVDLSKVIIVNNFNKKETKENILSDSDIAWQQQRRNRKIRRLDFEIR
tara:strand:- start:265 stop:516 length:252 start_codon:yes stop_codon:yes gene_type:complete